MLISPLPSVPIRPLNEDISRERLPPLYLLIVHPSRQSRTYLREAANKQRFIVTEAEDVDSARLMMRRQAVDLILLDPEEKGNRNESFFDEIRALHPETSLMALVSGAEQPKAIEAMKCGAVGYITFPFDLTTVETSLELARHQLHSSIRSRRAQERFRSQKSLGRVIGESQAVLALQKLIDQAARSDSPIMVTGDPGTGKELVARSIHFQSRRMAKPVLLFDCKSLVPSLQGSELFGHTKDAFPGLRNEQKGLLSLANTGTLILDGITDLPLDIQASLMRAIKKGIVQPLGGKRGHGISARIIATSSCDVKNLVDRGRFRRDLYTFLNMVRIHVPSLRERHEDIPELSAFFLKRVNRHMGTNKVLSSDSLDVLARCEWRGNVRELENAIEYACFRSIESVIQPRDLPPLLSNEGRLAMVRSEARSELVDSVAKSLVDTMKASSNGTEAFIGRPFVDIERDIILSTLAHTNGHVQEAAKLLQLGKTTLYRKIKEYGIEDNPSQNSVKVDSASATISN